MRARYIPPEYLPPIEYNKRLSDIVMPILIIVFGVVLLLLGAWSGSVYLYTFGWMLVIAGLIFLVLGVALNARKKTRPSSLSRQLS